MRSDAAPATLGFFPEQGIGTPLRWAAGTGLLAVAALATLVAGGIIDLAAIMRATAEISPAVLALVLALSLVNYGLRGLRWHVFTAQVSSDVSCRQSLVYYLAGFAFLLTPAKIGEAVRLWLLKSRHGVPYTHSIGLLVLDRAIDLICLVAFAGLGLLGRTEHAGALLAFLAILAAGIVVLSSRGLIIGSIRIAHRISGRRWPGMMRFALQSYRTLRNLCGARVMAIAIVLGMLAWGAQIGGTWLLLRALGFEADLATCAFVFAFSVLVGIVPLFPGGVGGADAAMAGLLLLIGAPPVVAVTATILSRLATLWFALLVGFAVAPFAFASAARKAVPTPVAC